jgi:hypothetical protein
LCYISKQSLCFFTTSTYNSSYFSLNFVSHLFLMLSITLTFWLSQVTSSWSKQQEYKFQTNEVPLLVLILTALFIQNHVPILPLNTLFTTQIITYMNRNALSKMLHENNGWKIMFSNNVMDVHDVLNYKSHYDAFKTIKLSTYVHVGCSSFNNCILHVPSFKCCTRKNSWFIWDIIPMLFVMQPFATNNKKWLEFTLIILNAPS